MGRIGILWKGKNCEIFTSVNLSSRKSTTTILSELTFALDQPDQLDEIIQRKRQFPMLLRRLVFFLLLVGTISSLKMQRRFKNKFDSLKKKMNNLIRGKKGNELFLDISELEYPKTNGTLRLAYKKQWNEYYDCLKSQLKDAGPERTTHPVALFALEGTSLTLKCKLCISPAELFTSESIEWMYRSSESGKTTEVPIGTSEHIHVTPDEKNLQLYDVQQADSGVYWCQLEDTSSAPYYLHVASGQAEETRLVRPERFNSPEENPTPSENLYEYGLKVYSLWSPWSPCTTCGKVGRRIRYGYCTISLLDSEDKNDETDATPEEEITEQKINDKIDNEEEKRNAVDETRSEMEKRSINSHRISKRENEEEEEAKETTQATSEKYAETTKLEVSDESGDEDDKKSPEEIKQLAQSILPVFRNRLPCRSPQTPKEIQKIKGIRRRKTEIMKGLCKVKCQMETIFEIRDKSGNVIESANNSAGIFSMVQGLPEPRPSVERTTMYRRHEKSVELSCPGNLNEDVPVVWQIGTKVVLPSEITKTTKGRISIDPRQRILIKKLRFADANIYSCWQRDELAGTIRLQVTNELELQVDHRVFMIGAIIIVSVMLFIFWRAFRGRKRYTIH